MSFDAAVAFVLTEEGGYANDPADPGGETNFGISHAAYPTLDLKALTREQAIDLYRQEFWDANHFDELPAALGLACFDAAVNQGSKRAIRWLQRVLGVRDDGVIGAQTIAAAHAAATSATLREFLTQRGFAYGTLETFPTFGHTWIRRLLNCHRTALALL